MEEQAFKLLRDMIKDIKSDISDLKNDFYAYRRHNNNKVTKLRIQVAKLILLSSLAGGVGGGVYKIASANSSVLTSK